MSRKTLPAKVSPPRLFDVVPRVRLFTILDDNRGRSLLWIAAPPGAGKTTLVATWLEARAIPSIWYQVDAEDADPAALFDHLTRAADALSGGLPPGLPRFAPEHLGDLSGFARLYFRALFTLLAPGTALVLDNYQDAPEGAALHEIVQECVRQTPRGCTIVAVSRTDAPPPFVQFIANGTMATVGWDRLQLTREEVIAICAKRGVTEGWLVQALHQQSQGWAAGITLMLEELYRRRLFIDRRPGPEPSYQFHALFLDFLRMRARTTYGAAELAERVARTAQALVDADNVDAAIELRLAHAQWDAAEALLLAHAAHLLETGRRETLRRWIDALPEERRASQPWLVYWQGRSLLQTEPENGTRVLERAVQLFRGDGNHGGLLDCLTALVSGAFLGFHALDAMDGWPDDDGDAAVNALSITLVRLRRLLGIAEAILHRGGRLSLNPDLCWVDALAFERQLAASASASLDTFALYGGTFLPEDESAAWTVATRERLRGRFIDALCNGGAALETAGDPAGAIRCYLRGVEADPVVEGFHQGLMRCYERTGRRTEAISVYRRMKQILSVVLGVPPSEASQRHYQWLLEQQAGESVGPERDAQVVELASHRQQAPRGR